MSFCRHIYFKLLILLAVFSMLINLSLYYIEFGIFLLSVMLCFVGHRPIGPFIILKLQNKDIAEFYIVQ